VIESVEIKIGHQFCFYIIHCFAEAFDEFIEIFFVEEDLMPVVSIRIKALAAFCDGEVIIIATGFPYIKKVSPAFPCPDAFALNAFHFFVVVFVRHWYKVLVFNDLPR
jgi:hypothetical protein